MADCGNVVKRCKYRIYPHPHQKRALAQAFGCARVVWNDALALKQEAWQERQERLSYVDLTKLCMTQAKQAPERAWLAGVSNIALQQSLRDLDQAFRNWWITLKGQGRARAPRFKRRHNHQSIRFTRGGFRCNDRTVNISKVGEIPIIWSRPLPGVPSSTTVIKDCAGRYFVSFVVQVERPCSPPVKGGIGIDLGLASLATTSDGEKISPPWGFTTHNFSAMKRFLLSALTFLAIQAPLPVAAEWYPYSLEDGSGEYGAVGFGEASLSDPGDPLLKTFMPTNAMLVLVGCKAARILFNKPHAIVGGWQTSISPFMGLEVSVQIDEVDETLMLYYSTAEGKENRAFFPFDSAIRFLAREWAQGEVFQLALNHRSGSAIWSFDLSGAAPAIAKACPEALD